MAIVDNFGRIVYIIFMRYRSKNNLKRHKCSWCGSVRYETEMEKIRSNTNPDYIYKTRFGHECWQCKECNDPYAKELREKRKFFYIY